MRCLKAVDYSKTVRYRTARNSYLYHELSKVVFRRADARSLLFSAFTRRPSLRSSSNFFIASCTKLLHRIKIVPGAHIGAEAMVCARRSESR